MVLEQKKDDTLKPWVNFHIINEVLIRDSFPLPLYITFFDKIRGITVSTKLRLHSAYNQIYIKEDYVWKTSFPTLKVQYEYLVILFELKNSHVNFQHFM